MAIAELVLVVARGGHPRPIACGHLVLEEEVAPRLGAIGADIGVAQVAVEQVEQRLHSFDLGRVVGGPRRGEAVAGFRRCLIAETREAECRTTAGAVVKLPYLPAEPSCSTEYV